MSLESLVKRSDILPSLGQGEKRFWIEAEALIYIRSLYRSFIRSTIKEARSCG